MLTTPFPRTRAAASDGRPEAGSSSLPASGTFHCPEWPTCGCPRGTMHHDCPGLRELADRHGTDAEWTLDHIRRANPLPRKLGKEARERIAKHANLRDGGSLARWHGEGSLPNGWWVAPAVLVSAALWAVMLWLLIPGLDCVGCGL